MAEDELDRAVQDLVDAHDRYWDAYRGHTKVWQPLPFLPRFNAIEVAWLWIMFHVGLFVTGIVLAISFSSGALGNIGLALIVGSIFAIGTFASQVWVVASDRQRLLRERTLGETYYMSDLVGLGAEFTAAAKRYRELTGRDYFRPPIGWSGLRDVRRHAAARHKDAESRNSNGPTTQRLQKAIETSQPDTEPQGHSN